MFILAKLERGLQNNITHDINPAKSKVFLSSDGQISCAVINNVISILFDVTVIHTKCSINFKAPKSKNNSNLEKEEFLQTINNYDQGYCLLEGISADGIRDRNLEDFTNEKFAPKNDIAAHLIPFFKAKVNNQNRTFVMWDTYSRDEKPIELRSICDIKDLQSNLLYNYNFIIIYGIKHKEKELSLTQKQHHYRRQLEELELQQIEIKKRKQDIKDKLSMLKKQKRETK